MTFTPTQLAALLDEADHHPWESVQAALARVVDWLTGSGWTVQATAESPITGGDGNVEFLLWARRGGQ